jgi:predicted nucleic acid-binding protein
VERVFPDSNVLFRISVADLTFRLAEIELHTVLWTDDLLDEVQRVLVRRKGLTPAAASYFGDCIRETFPGGHIPRGAYQDLIPLQHGPDPHDHVHAAACAAGGATVLLTSNLRDFSPADLAPTRCLDPDAYFSGLLHDDPGPILDVVVQMGLDRSTPVEVAETLAALSAAGLPSFAAAAAVRFGSGRDHDRPSRLPPPPPT